jgi:hypothetical protein
MTATRNSDLDDEAYRRCSQFHAHCLVGDPGIPSKERQGFAEVFRRRGDIEEDPRVARIGLLGQMKTESGVLNCFRGAVEQPALSRRRYAMLEGTARRKVALRYACVAQHRGGGRASIALFAAKPIAVGRACEVASSVTSMLTVSRRE